METLVNFTNSHSFIAIAAIIGLLAGIATILQLFKKDKANKTLLNNSQVIHNGSGDIINAKQVTINKKK